jgi:hypothetical protein
MTWPSGLQLTVNSTHSLERLLVSFWTDSVLYTTNNLCVRCAQCLVSQHFSCVPDVNRTLFVRRAPLDCNTTATALTANNNNNICKDTDNFNKDVALKDIFKHCLHLDPPPPPQILWSSFCTLYHAVSVLFYWIYFLVFYVTCALLVLILLFSVLSCNLPSLAITKHRN